MNPLFIQLTLSGLAGMAILRLFRSAHRSARIARLVVWGPVFSVSLAVVWFPDLATRFARLVGVARGVDAVMYVAIASLGFLVVKLYASHEKQDQVITRLVSELALIKGHAPHTGQRGARALPKDG